MEIQETRFISPIKMVSMIYALKVAMLQENIADLPFFGYIQ